MTTQSSPTGRFSRTAARRLIASGIALVALAAVTACGPAGANPNTLANEQPTNTTTTTAPASTTPSTTPSTTVTTPSTSGSPTTEASTTAPPATTKPAKPATTAPKPILAKGDQGEKVRELQVRLREIAWFSGTITGNYGDTTAKAVAGFQEKRGLPDTGAVDAKTWQSLAAMTDTPTHDEKHNVLRPGKAILKQGMESAKVKDLQARLAQIDWFSEKVTGFYGPATVASVKGFQEKRQIPQTGEVDQRTWDRLASMTRQPTKEELDGRPPAQSTTPAGDLDSRCMTGRVMCVSKTSRQLTWLIDGKVIRTMDARFGCASSITREGLFHVGWKSRDHVSTDYNSPMPFAMFFSGGEAVHYSSDFAARGYNGCSHGCVNIRDRAGVAWLFDQVRVGDKVVVHW